jgi:hypothetical protein
MYSIASRAGLRPLAAIIGLVASATLGACADATTAPAVNTPSRASAAEAPAPGLLNTTVTLSAASRASFYPNGYAAIDVAVSCSTNATFDVVVDLEQQQKAGATRITVAGSDTTATQVECTTGAGISWTAAIVPTTGAFRRGGGTVRMYIANYQPGVTPAEIEKRVRLVEAVE